MLREKLTEHINYDPESIAATIHATIILILTLKLFYTQFTLWIILITLNHIIWGTSQDYLPITSEIITRLRQHISHIFSK